MAGHEVHITLTEYENEKLKSLAEAYTRPSTSDKPLIQEVTHIFPLCYTTEECKRYFEPTYVTLGPLSNGKRTTGDSRFEGGEECKRRLAAMFIKLANGTMEGFYKDVKREIDSLKNCYNSKGQEWNDEELAFMFLVDGCALLHFILLDVHVEWKEFIGTDDLIVFERVDFFLLENQLPYRLLEILMDSFAKFSGADFRDIVEKIFKKSIDEFINRIYLNLTARADRSQPHHPYEQQRPQLKKFSSEKLTKFFKESIRHFIYRIYLTAQQRHPSDPSDPKQQQQQQQQQKSPVHLLDLLRRRLVGVKSKEKGEKQKQISIDILEKMDCDNGKSNKWQSNRSVTELKDKGIRFKAREKEGAITDVDFSDRCFMRTFELVPIFLHDTTMPILLNLIAYELCPDFKETCDITSYLLFLNSLIDNWEDVKELKGAGVLHNALGRDEAVADLFNKISRNLVPIFKRDSELRRNINEYCSNESHLRSLCVNIQARLTHTYFRRPWAFLVFLGALAALIMTGMQTYSSFHENHSSEP